MEYSVGLSVDENHLRRKNIKLSSPQQELFFSDLFSAFARNIQLEIYRTYKNMMKLQYA